ncbi:MAG: YihY family inner membrane protein [Verrucomicrobia bacterium]|nr:YihY family inner membrane protein [Verrucomicrobiota bacterium]
MAQGKPSLWTILWRQALDILKRDPTDLDSYRPAVRRLYLLWLFFQQVVLGFRDKRCSLRAAALCYTTLLALVPLLAVGFSVSKSFLRESSTTVVPQAIDVFIAKVAPQLEVLPPAGATNAAVAAGQVTVSDDARHEVVENIQQFIGNIDAGTLGVLGTLALILIAIRLLMTIEETFNDIWGVAQGRSIWRKVVYYWASVTLGPLVVLTALTLTGSGEFAQTLNQFVAVPWLERFVFKALPYLILWLGFGALYGLMPNTSVRWWAAAAGGIVAGTLWQLNSILNTMYISRVVTYSKIYGSLGILPVFLLGLYFSWLIILFGAHVSFAVQNHTAYLQQRASERLDQFGRERLACRLVLLVSRQFLNSLPPLSIEEIASRLTVPGSLIRRLATRLAEAGLLTLTADEPVRLQPARMPDTFTVADVLDILRSNGDGAAGAKRNAGVVESLLSDLCAAEHAAPANLRFSELAARAEKA